ncbi:MAG: hypothetical protein HYY44_02545 [Deltaproteobacteria bacterium]|nr:hypothetical protein [Deltaproteobacteria bacterium]MBI4374450.1 hypothetical protein [Deltaproteobacteria bacterium]
MKNSLFLLLFCLILFSCTGSETETGPSGTLADEVPGPASELEFKSAVTSTAGDVGAEAGFIGDGDKITLPTGFTADQCVFTASLASVSGSSLASRVVVNKTTGVVTCKSLVQEREEVQPIEKSCSASYVVICAK